VNEKVFFHGSMSYLEKGTVLVPQKNYESRWGHTDFYNLLEKYRPLNCLAHKHAVFMCDNDEDVDMAGGGTIWLFKVKPIGPVSKHDLNWSSEISMLASEGYIKNRESKIRKCAKNYWAGVPHENETVWEYLCQKAEIIHVEAFDDLGPCSLR
jgi:hypothetical protein